MAEKTFEELEAQADAMIRTLTMQRNAVQEQVINLLGQNAILEVRLRNAMESAARAGAESGDGDRKEI